MKSRSQRLFIGLSKLALLSLISVFVLIPKTNAFFVDAKMSNDNLMTAGTLSFAANSTESDFTPATAMQPGDEVQRNVFLNKVGSLPLQYKANYQYVSGDTNLCNNLQLEVDYQYFTAVPSNASDFSNLQSVVKYTGNLSAFNDFDTNNPTHDSDLVLPSTQAYYTNSYYSAGQAWLVYKVSLPSGADASLQNKSCNFDLTTQGWQQNLANNSSGFTDTQTISGGVSSDSWSDIVLNEFMPNPTTTGYRPDGEWVELYNNSGADIDVNGWVIKDSINHQLIISSSNSDNDLDLVTGETVVPAHGWLTTYFDSWSVLNNSGDTVRLFNGSNLIDQYAYGSASVNKSYARIPDGTGAWVDPVPTPGRASANTTADLIPTIKIWQQDAENAKIGIFDAVNYPGAEYLITYDHSEDWMTTISEAIVGTMSINDQDEIKGDLYFGTCSSGGTCTPHHNITNVHLKVDFPDSSIPSLTLETDMAGSWTGSAIPAL